MKKIYGILLILLFSAPVLAQNNSFRFAWLTDTHVGGATGRDDLSRSVRDINGLDSLDFVILSGDITQTGKGTDLELAKSILDSLTIPYYIIPGNHDCKWSESGATKFRQLWGNDRFVFEKNGIMFLGMHEGPIMRMADGHFSPEDLRWLDETLKGIKKDQRLVIVTHYPIDPSIDNWYELLNRIKPYNVQAVLVGHGHANRKMNFEGVPGVMGRSNLRARDVTGGFNIVEVKGDSIFFSERKTLTETLRFWHRLPLGGMNYLTDTVKYSRPDFSVNVTYSNVKPVWRKETGFLIASAPALWNNMLFTGNSGGEFRSFSVKDGKELWRFKAANAIYSTPAVSDGMVVFASCDSSIYCLDAVKGTLKWKYRTENTVVASPVIYNGNVFIGGSDNKFRAINLKTGQPVWEYGGVSDFVETRPLIYQNKVIFGAWDIYLYALDIKNGAPVWKWSNGNKEVLYSPAAVWPVASEGKIFVAAPDRYLTAIDAGSGTTVWRTNEYLVRETVGISEDGRTIFSRTMNDTVFAFDPKPGKLENRWVARTGFGYDINPSMPVEKQGTLFFSTKNGFVYALDAKSGSTKWIYRTGAVLANTVVPLSADKCAVTTMDGSVMVLGI